MLQEQLSCGPMFVYMNGFVHGVHGGFGSFCADTPDARKALHDSRKRGYLPGYCETCLGVPAGSIFVIWAETGGPDCPDGCTPNQLGEHAPLL